MSTQSDHEFAPTQISAAEFPTEFRGYDKDAVRRYLTRLASALEEKGGDALAALARTTTLDRIEELEEENDVLRSDVRDLELELVQRSVDGPNQARPRTNAGEDGDEDQLTIDVDSEFDEHRAIELLGKETARVLESARSAASDIVKKAERQAKTVEKDARGELAESRRKSRRLMAEKQAEAEELVAKVATEAEESAARLRTEADQHREMVLVESKRIMADAESQAEADERWAQQRAEQIVADAEALRQQLLSELVVERTRVRTDLEEMSTARDRLVMALVVARSELDEMSKRLDVVVAPSTESGRGDSDTAVEVDIDEDEAKAQVEQLVADLDDDLPPIGEGPPKRASSKTSKRASAKTTRNPKSRPKSKSNVEPDPDDAPDQSDDVIDLTDGGRDQDGLGDSDAPDASGRNSSKRTTKGSKDNAESVADGESTTKPSVRNGTTRKSSKARKKSRRSGTGTGSKASSKPTPTGAATAVADPPSDATAATDHAQDDTTDIDVDIDAAEEVLEIEADDIADDADDADDTEDGTEDDTEDAEDVELSLIEGFNTIELTESELGLSTGGGVTSADDELDQVIITVVSREHGEHVEGNRGDLLIDEIYRGRLPSAIAARDNALDSADEFHRSIRRALNDDQSEVLDRLRGGRGAIEISELPRFSDQIERYLQPLRDGLAPVALAGAKTGGRREISAGVLDNLAKQLAKYIVDKVRIPVIREVEHATDHDREKLFEPVRSIYRDFRNTGLLDLADDALYESFAIGLYGAIPAGTAIVWLLDPRHDPDPVCEINAGRSGLVKGQKFPSGHVRPLALPNCRCLVVPD